MFLSSCQYVKPVIDAIEPYIEIVKPNTDEKMEIMSDLIVKVIKLEAGKDLPNVISLINKINKSLKPEENAITIPNIFDVSGLSEKNKLRIGILINAIELEYGKTTITTPKEYQWVLQLISKIQEKLS
jgi:hypothetical protein